MKPHASLIVPLVLLVLATAGLTAQNPNGPLGSLTVNGIDGPPFPIVAPLTSPGSLSLTLGGLPFSPYLVAHNPLAPGTAVVPGAGGPGFVDIALDPMPTILFNGFGGGLASLFAIGAGGMSTIVLSIPPGLTGTLGAIQAAVAAPTPAGVALTAATELVVGPTGGTLPIGPGGSAELVLPCPFTFYGVPYASVWVNANGNLTFGTPDPILFGTAALNLAGPPRISPFWHAFDPTYSVGGSTPSITWSTTGAATTITWTDVVEITPPTYVGPCISAGGLGCATSHRHTFSVTLACDGTITFDYTSNRQKSNIAIVGMSPGFGISTAGSMNLSLAMPMTGALLDAIHEQFLGRIAGGIPGRFDLHGRTLTFTPSGPPGSPTSAYTLASSPVTPRIDYVPPLAIDGSIKTLHGAGFVPGATVQYRLSAIGGFWSAMASSFYISSEELWFTHPTLLPNTVIDVRVFQPGASPEWIRAMETGASGGTAFGPVLFGTENAGIGIPGPAPVIYGTAYSNVPAPTIFVNKNGYVTFGAQSTVQAGSAAVMAAPPVKAAVLWTDLNVPSLQTSFADPIVTYMTSTYALDPAARHKVFWRCAPEYPDSGSNTFSVEIRGAGTSNGIIAAQYGPGIITAEDAVAGISAGAGGLAGDLSALANAYTTGAYSGLWEVFAPGGPAFDLLGLTLRWVPANYPTNTTWSLLSP